MRPTEDTWGEDRVKTELVLGQKPRKTSEDTLHFFGRHPTELAQCITRWGQENPEAVVLASIPDITAGELRGMYLCLRS
jgi:hypothetical protein